MWHFFVWLEHPISFVPQTSCHYQMVGSTGSRRTQVAQRSCQFNRWGGHKRGMRNQQLPPVTKTLPTDGLNSRAWKNLQMSASYPWVRKKSVGCLMGHQVFLESKNRMWLMQLPMKWCNAKNVWQTMNRAATPQSLHLPVRLCSVNLRMDHNNLDYNNLDYNKMDYGTMDSHYVCDLCDISFTRNSDLKRHMESKHGWDTKQGHTCGECGERFSRKDVLKRHQLTCQVICFQCPRCHRVLKDIVSLTWHMGLCLVPCGMCQDQFVKLDQLSGHQKSHRKWKATSDPLAHKLKKRKCDGWFHYLVCLNSFASRKELFHHRLEHMDDSRAYQPMTPHFDFEDEKLNTLLRDNTQLIFGHHRFSLVSAEFNFPLTLPLKRDGWLNEIYQTLYLVANINNDESFKFNFSMGFIMVNWDSGDYRFFVSRANNDFFNNYIHNWTRKPWKPMSRITKKIPSGSSSWSLMSSFTSTT